LGEARITVLGDRDVGKSGKFSFAFLVLIRIAANLCLKDEKIETRLQSQKQTHSLEIQLQVFSASSRLQ
jgi:hypothetical protein